MTELKNARESYNIARNYNYKYQDKVFLECIETINKAAVSGLYGVKFWGQLEERHLKCLNEHGYEVTQNENYAYYNIYWDNPHFDSQIQL